MDSEICNHLMFAPAYTSSEKEIHQIVDTARETYDQVVSEMRKEQKLMYTTSYGLGHQDD